MWRSLSWNRNIEKENALYDRLGLKEREKYVLVNYNFKDQFEKCDEMKAYHFGDDKIIFMDNLSGFTMLDWSKVICNAERIYTVETALLYIVEVLPIKATEIHLFARTPYQDTLVGVKNFISDRWIKHEKI
jgi:hypothetical protein